MRILHICVNYGTPLYQPFMTKISEAGIDQHVIYPRRNIHRIVNPHIPGLTIDSPCVLNKITRLSFSYKMRVMENHFLPVIKSFNPGIIHAHTLFSDGSLALKASKTMGIPYVVAVRTTDTEIFLKYRPWLKGLGADILDSAATIVCLSPSINNDIEKEYGSSFRSKTRVIPNGIDDLFHAPDQIPKSNISGKPNLLYVGNFSRLKNVERILEFSKKHNMGLTIAGKGGNNEKRVLRAIKKSPQVKYPGEVKDKLVLKNLYRNSDIFIMPSFRETFGLVYIESMSQGTPVIFSEGNGIDGYFDEGTIGYGVNPRDMGSWDKQINRIIENYNSISGNCLHESKRFNWDIIVKQYMEIYNKAAK